MASGDAVTQQLRAPVHGGCLRGRRAPQRAITRPSNRNDLDPHVPDVSLSPSFICLAYKPWRTYQNLSLSASTCSSPAWVSSQPRYRFRYVHVLTRHPSALSCTEHRANSVLVVYLDTDPRVGPLYLCTRESQRAEPGCHH